MEKKYRETITEALQQLEQNGGQVCNVNARGIGHRKGD